MGSAGLTQSSIDIAATSGYYYATYEYYRWANGAAASRWNGANYCAA
jgi:hypothetical protein